jgi:two-component system sensor histidine kinase MprB
VAAGKAPTFYYDTELGGQDVRVLTIPTDTSKQAGLPASLRFAIQVVAPLAGVDHELAKIRLWLFLVCLGGVALASGAGLLVARSTLRPVRDLSEAAERVRATRDLSQRITVKGSDELSQLAFTFNEMLAALDEAATRQQRLVQDASHELRTPLTSLRTNIEVLANGGALPPEERTQLLHDVVEQLGEMTALISELTELARGSEQATAREDVRLDLVAEDAVRRTMRNHPSVPVVTDLVPTHVVGTPASLERAIANLLDNAAKWSPAGAPVELTLRDGELTVRDHGPGIAESDAPHIFERFYRADAARSMPGSGLGLAIVRQVAEAHGGTISFEPAPGGGALMRLRLALREQGPGEAEASAAAEASAQDGNPSARGPGDAHTHPLAAARRGLRGPRGSRAAEWRWVRRRRGGAGHTS